MRGYLPNGQRVRPTLGEWPSVGIAKARKAVVVTAGDLARGNNPTEARREAKREREARKDMPTVTARLAQWREAKAADWSARYASEVERLCRKIIEPAIGKLLLVETTRSTWADMITAERAERPSTATWLFQLSKAFLNYAEALGWISSNPLPRKGLAVLAPKAESRERVLTDDELIAVWRAADKLNPKLRCFIRLLILTGARVSEVAGLAWGELNLPDGLWALPSTRAKNNQPITLPLNSLALTELQAVLPPDGVGPNHRLLGRGGALQGISRVKRALDQHSGVTDWTMHDLRRTCRTGLSRIGVPTEHAEAALNHVSHRSALVRTYDRHDFGDEVLAALGKWQDEVARLLRAQRGLHLVVG
jgi:integrase